MQEIVNLRVTYNNTIIFTHKGSWLHPLFALEDFLAAQSFPHEQLHIEDKLIGIAAAVLIIRLGCKSCHAKVLSQKAIPLLETHGIQYSYTTLVDSLTCSTESLLTKSMSIDESYNILAIRAGRIID